MTICQVCGKENSDSARYCFGCGTTLPQAPQVKMTPPVKVDLKSPLAYPPTSQPISPPRSIPRPGSCFYHSDLPSSFVCSRCGRSICVGCSRQYGMLTFCTECFWGLAPKIGFTPAQYGYQVGQGRSFF